MHQKQCSDRRVLQYANVAGIGYGIKVRERVYSSVCAHCRIVKMLGEHHLLDSYGLCDVIALRLHLLQNGYTAISPS